MDMAKEVMTTLHRQGTDAINGSFAQFGVARYLFAVASPPIGSTVEVEMRGVLDAIAAVLQDTPMLGGVVQQTVFLADFSQADYCHQLLCRFYGSELPVTTYVSQPPCNGKSLLIELFGVQPEPGTVAIERVREKLVVVRYDDVAWAYVANAIPGDAVSTVYDQTTASLQSLQGLLLRSDMRLDQTIRTWFYLGDILASEGEKRRYERFNAARTDFYADACFFQPHISARSTSAYPASTAIGARGIGIGTSAIALSTDRSDVVAVPLENPQQQPAASYAPDGDQESPRFARAVAVAVGDDAMIFISGTASITESDSRHVGDVVAQTNQTLDNIAMLISKDNLSRHGLLGFGASLQDLAAMRVYLKRPQDYPIVRQICEDRIGKIPVVYVVADICRPELLVEIEGIAFSSQSNSIGTEPCC
jgi:enamine deaminase RidA (YjgF/YER057c/UK114 family)